MVKAGLTVICDKCFNIMRLEFSEAELRKALATIEQGKRLIDPHFTVKRVMKDKALGKDRK